MLAHGWRDYISRSRYFDHWRGADGGGRGQANRRVRKILNALPVIFRVAALRKHFEVVDESPNRIAELLRSANASTSQWPALAIRLLEQRVGLGVADDLALLRVVLDFLADAVSDHAHEDGFEVIGAVLEVTGRLEAALGRVDPLLLEVAHGLQHRFLRAWLVIDERMIAERVNKAIAEVRNHIAFAAFPHRAVINLLKVNRAVR